MDSLPRVPGESYKSHRLRLSSAIICQRYVAGETTYELASAFDCSDVTIGNILRRNKITTRPFTLAGRKYACDHSFFDRIDSEPKAYWLGFIAADGCIVKTKWSPVLLITLSQVDLAHLEAFRDAIGSNQPVRIEAGRGSYGGPKARFGVTSSQLVAGLQRHGITYHKTASHAWPALPEHLIRHYLRGYFDGDGCFTRSGTSNLVFDLTGSFPFITATQEFMSETLDLRKNKIYPHSLSKLVCSIRWAGESQITKIAHYFYTDATIYLPRKRTKVAHLL